MVLQPDCLHSPPTGHWAEGVTGKSGEDADTLRAFAPIERVARVMAGFPRPWFVSGGWAIELFVGRVTREHEDLEVGLFRRDQGALWAYLSGWELCKAQSD